MSNGFGTGLVYSGLTQVRRIITVVDQEYDLLHSRVCAERYIKTPQIFDKRLDSRSAGVSCYKLPRTSA